ncbi:MAG: HAMP domain-containing histidine kinase [Actinobacteria bacterium]|nr:HAMP domain-containing histidine kinase [Actinomycetota bacterium]
MIGISLEGLDATLSAIRRVQLGAAAAVLGALALVSWWMLRLGVHPLTHMASTADAIAGGDLSRVDHLDPTTEAGRLGVAFNTMLERIEEGFRAREESEARVRQFAADASHELRTPLTSIQGYAELWRAGGLRDESALAEGMRRIEQEASRMAALVEDLLLLARMDQQRPLGRSPVRLDVVVSEAVADARAVEPDRPLSLDTRPVVLDGDEMRLRQAVGNLLGNARVHTPAGTPVRVSLTADDGTARLEVADEGPGLSPEVSNKVFERFYRADQARSRAAGGAGLGLAIVAAVAEAHGDQVGHRGPGDDVEAADGRGTTVAGRCRVDPHVRRAGRGGGRDVEQDGLHPLRRNASAAQHRQLHGATRVEPAGDPGAVAGVEQSRRLHRDVGRLTRGRRRGAGGGRREGGQPGEREQGGEGEDQSLHGRTVLLRAGARGTPDPGTSATCPAPTGPPPHPSSRPS